MTSLDDLSQARAYVTGGLSIGWPMSVAPQPSGAGHDQSVHAWLTTGSDGDFALVIRAPNAHRIEVRGDFTDWVTKDGIPDRNGQWKLPIFIKPGMHRVTISIDGGAWAPPAGLPVATDDFGGTVGILIAPSGT